MLDEILKKLESLLQMQENMPVIAPDFSKKAVTDLKSRSLDLESMAMDRTIEDPVIRVRLMEQLTDHAGWQLETASSQEKEEEDGYEAAIASSAGKIRRRTFDLDEGKTGPDGPEFG